MDYLDKPSIPDPATVSNRALAIRYGGIWAAASFLMTVMGFLTNTDPGLPSTSTTMKILYTVLGLGVSIWAITSAIRIDRDQQLGGFISLGRCVGLGTFIGLISGLIGGVLHLIYTQIINPGYADTMKEALQQQFAEQGMSEEAIEQALSMSAMFTGPVATFIIYVIGGLIFGVLVGLVAGIFMKREALPNR